MNDELELVFHREQMLADERSVELAAFRGDKLVLICDALLRPRGGTARPDDREFDPTRGAAVALPRWSQKRGLTPNGITANTRTAEPLATPIIIGRIHNSGHSLGPY